jgi:prepilin-type N-terminal cleavage/methylation domain-containing protein
LKLLKSNQKGLTLIEVLLAITILSIILASVVPFLIQSVKNNKMVETSHQSIYFAKEKLTTVQSSNGIQSFLSNIQNQVDPQELLRTNYPDLNLSKDIGSVQLIEQSSTSSTLPMDYYVLEIIEEPLKMEIYIRSVSDYSGNPKLYRAILHVYDENNKLLTKSFGYVKYKK